MSGFRFAGAQYSLVYGVANINSYFLDENVLQEPAANQQATWPRRMRHIIGKSEEQFGKTDENSASLSEGAVSPCDVGIIGESTQRARQGTATPDREG